MIATIDIGRIPLTALRRPSESATQGLRWSQVALLPRLGSLRPPSLRRAALIAFWDDEEAARRSLDLHPLRQPSPDPSGFHVVLQPIRAFGTWPGLDEGIPRHRRVDHDGGVLVLTLGQLRVTQVGRFLRSSRPAERSALAAPGFLWGTAAARPPFVATITAWSTGEAAVSYAYENGGAHGTAITAQRRKDFHRRSAFIRFAVTDGDLSPGPTERR